MSLDSFTRVSAMIDDVFPGSAGPGVFEGVPRAAQSFHHGERTADLGRLGDTSGAVSVTAPGPLSVTDVRWELRAPIVGLVEGTTLDRTVSGGVTDPVSVYAGAPGLYLLRLFALENGRQGDELGRLVVSVPAFVTVELDGAFTAALGTLADDAGVTPVDLLADLRAVTHHLLRPANVRLLWPDDQGDHQLPPQFTLPDDTPTDIDGLVSGLVESPTVVEGTGLRWLRTVKLSVPATAPTVDPFSVARVDGDWTVAADSDLRPLSGDTDVETYLDSLADGSVARRRATTRCLGVALARAVLQGLGLAEVENAPRDLLGDTLDDPKRHLLGVGDVNGSESDLVEHYAQRWRLVADANATRLTDRYERLTPLDVLAGVTEAGSYEDLERLFPLGPAYGGYPLRLEDRDQDSDPWNPGAANTGGPRYGGRELTRTNASEGALPARGEAYVEQLQYDLRRVGVTLVPDSSSPAVGSMGGTAPRDTDSDGDVDRVERTSPHLRTEWAVREFQSGASYPNAALDGLGAERLYSANLTATENPSSDRLEVTGVVDSPTAARLRRWRLTRLRHPVVVEAWTVAGGNPTGIHFDSSRTGATTPDPTVDTVYDNLWHERDLQVDAPRILVRDLSGFEPFDAGDTYPTDETVPAALAGAGGTDRHTVGYYESDAYGGPNVDPEFHSRTAVEVTPWNCTSAIAGIADFQGATPTWDANTDACQAFQVVRAVSEAECEGYFDVLQSWDSAVVSVPLLHYTLWLPTPSNRGELGGYLAYLYHRSREEYRHYLGNAGCWFNRVYGEGTTARAGTHFPNDRKHVGMVQVLSREPPGDEFIGELTRRAHETEFERVGYAGWFRSWHWFYRFQRAFRASSAVREAANELALVRLADLLDAGHTVNGQQVSTVVSSEMAVAMLLRLHVRGTNEARVNRYLEAVEGAVQRAGEADIEEARIRRGLEFIRGAGVERTLRGTAGWSADATRHGLTQQLVNGLSAAQTDALFGPDNATAFTLTQEPDRDANNAVRVVGGVIQWQNTQRAVQTIRSRLSTAQNSFPAPGNIGAPVVPDLSQNATWNAAIAGLPAWDDA